MSDQTPTIGQQAAGQPPVTPVQPEYLTRAEAEAMTKQAEEAAFRRMQGLFDKRDKAIQEKINELKAAGITATPEQAAQLVRPEPSEPAQPAQPAQAANDDALDPVTTIAVGLEKRYGVEITEQDPEFKTIKTTGEPDEYLETYLQAIQAKKLRLQPQRTPTNLGQAGGPAPQQRSLKNYREQLEKGLSGG